MTGYYEMTAREKIEEFKREFNRLGLYIFESFEEYMEDKMDLIENDGEY